MNNYIAITDFTKYEDDTCSIRIEYYNQRTSTVESMYFGRTTKESLIQLADALEDADVWSREQEDIFIGDLEAVWTQGPLKIPFMFSFAIATGIALWGLTKYF